jgi:Ca2+-transporting ATPase
MTPWHTLSPEEIQRRLHTSPEGLNDADVKQRIEKYGPNELKEKKKKSVIERFLGQFTSAPIIMLIVAIIILVALTFLFHEDHTPDAVVIFIVIFVNAIMGFVQESKAEKAMEALKKLTSPRAKVVRCGETVIVDVGTVVPGDILSLEEGDKVAADARIMTSTTLEIDESMLTGESLPARKGEEAILDPKALIQDRSDMAYAGTVITRGRCCAIVVSTGMETEMGRIASFIQDEEEPTPLQKRLDTLGKQIAYIAIFLVVLLFALNQFARESNVVESFLLSVSLAVAIIPEGLPIVSLVTLAMGMQAMAKRNAVVRKLMCVETLGSTTYICSDKTGTLTRNQMTIREMFIGGIHYSVKGDGYEPKGTILRDGKPADLKEPSLDEALHIMALCNDSHLADKKGKWTVVGDPTEGALLSVVGKADMKPGDMAVDHIRCGEKVFDPRRKMMTTVHKTPRGVVAFVKGAPEIILELAGRVMNDGKTHLIGPELRKEILDINAGYAAKAYRVLAFGSRLLPDEADCTAEDVERGLTFIGMVAILDPPREEVAAAVEECHKAGMHVVMITGDQRETGKAVAKKLGILDTDDGILTGAELSKMSDEEFNAKVKDIRVYTRVSPEHKMKIVQALQGKGEVVAMTGDGVNDAPALAKADIGIAMGISGTDVAREASDMVLMDDNFSTIVAAVEEGRRIYSNIRKFIRYQLSTNFGAIFLLFAATLLALRAIPLYPVQILWINILMDGPPAVALGLAPGSKKLMKQPPRDPQEKILNKKIIQIVAFNGIFMGFLTFMLFWYDLSLWDPSSKYGIAHSETLTFTAFVIFQMFSVFNCNSRTRSAINRDLKKNPFLLMAVTASVLLQLCVVYVPPLQVMFHTVPLDLRDWALILGCGLLVLIVEETRKAVVRKLHPEPV